MRDYAGHYLIVVVLFAIGGVLVGGALTLGRLLRPDHPTAEKSIGYERGVDPAGAGWAQVHIRSYAFAYLHVVFAVDAVFLFPWAMVFSRPGYGFTTLGEMFVFLGFPAVGLVYAWRRKVLPRG